MYYYSFFRANPRIGLLENLLGSASGYQEFDQDPQFTVAMPKEEGPTERLREVLERGEDRNRDRRRKALLWQAEEQQLYNQILDTRAEAFKSGGEIYRAEKEARRLADTLRERVKRDPSPHALLLRRMGELQKSYGLSVDRAEAMMGSLIDAGGLGDPKELKPLLPAVAEDLRDLQAERD